MGNGGIGFFPISPPMPSRAPDTDLPPRPPAGTLRQSAASLLWSALLQARLGSPPDISAASFPGSAQCHPPAPAPTPAPAAQACIPSLSQSPPPAAPDQDSSGNFLPESVGCSADNHPPANLRSAETARSEIRVPADCKPRSQCPVRDMWPESPARDRGSTKNIQSATLR